MRLPLILLLLSLVSLNLFGMENLAQDSVIISQHEFLLFFKNKFKYDLFDNWFEYKYSFREDVEEKYDKLYNYIQKNNSLNLEIGNLRDFFIQIGLKQKKEYVDKFQYSKMLSEFHREEIFSIKTSKNPLDVIKGLKKVFMSYFEEDNLDKRRLLKDEYIADLPHIHIIIARLSTQEIIITGAPAMRQDEMFEGWEVDYVALFKQSPFPRWPIYVLGLAGVLSLFIPVVDLKFPSLVDYWAEQMASFFLMEDHLNVLGLASDATFSLIKSTCRQLFLQWHPDKNPSPNATITFQLIQASCNFLRK